MEGIPSYKVLKTICSCGKPAYFPLRYGKLIYFIYFYSIYLKIFFVNVKKLTLTKWLFITKIYFNIPTYVMLIKITNSYFRITEQKEEKRRQLKKEDYEKGQLFRLRSWPRFLSLRQHSGYERSYVRTFESHRKQGKL